MENGVMTKIYFKPVHLKSIYRLKFGYKEGDLPVTEKISKRVLSLPIYPKLEVEDQDLVIETVQKFLVD
jgi:dTDP-4-amino-4,6-dideoxygalactose transaminase